MRKNRRFLAGLLTAALILQPITAVGEEMPAQEEFGASELMDDEGYVPDDDQQEADLKASWQKIRGKMASQMRIIWKLLRALQRKKLPQNFWQKIR